MVLLWMCIMLMCEDMFWNTMEVEYPNTTDIVYSIDTKEDYRLFDTFTKWQAKCK